MPEAPAPQTRIALLIDGDNAQASLLKEIIAETGKYGLVSVRRIYGDWTSPNMHGWKEPLSVHAIQPIQQFRNTVGKNATDSAMIIDAMDLLYERVVDGFCLVSSDSDYTRLATRLREKGTFVMGIGKTTTPKAFVNACEVFVFTENLIPPPPPPRPAPRTVAKGPAPAKAPDKKDAPDPVPLLLQAFDLCVREDGRAALGEMGAKLLQLDPSFDSRSYGYRQLSRLISAQKDAFQVKQTKNDLFVTLRPRPQ